MAGSKSRTLEVNILKLLLNNVSIANLGDALGVQGSTVAGNVYVRLHNTALVDDTSLGTEATYTGYIPGGVAIPRSPAGWTVDVVNGSAKNTAEFKFGKCTAGSETIKYFSIWMDGTTQTLSHRLWHGELPANFIVSVDTEPLFPAEYLIINEN